MTRFLSRLLIILPLLGCSCGDDDGESRVPWSFPDTITEDLAPPANADILLETSLTIPPGISLTLLPGTRITFANNSTLRVRGDFIVDGTVTMRGRSASEEDWVLMVDMQSGGNCQIEGLEATGGNPPLWLQGGSPVVDGFTAEGTPLALMISSPVGGTVENVTLSSTGRQGVGLDVVYGSILVLRGVAITGFEYGLQFNNSVITVRESTIEDCDIGMYFSHGLGRVEYTLVKDCRYGCRYVYTSSTDLYRVQFEDMTNGVQLHAFAGATDFDELNFINTPIAFRYLPDAAEYNPPRRIDVSGCWFGTTDSAAIADMLVDARDLGGNVDTLLFVPFATSPWGLLP